MDNNQVIADVKQSVITCFQKYVDFSGRAARPEFWWFALFTLVVSLLIQMVLGYWIANLFSLAVLLPSLAVGARRLHDMGKSGWFQLLWMIPILGWAVMIYWLVQPTAGPNQYGDGPSVHVPAAMPPGAV
jgi:uncharacterized membrane protein YhaH (DUF805 family)